MGRPSPGNNLGDVDMDGEVTYADALLVARYNAGLETLTDEQKRRADVSARGEYDIVDALFIEQYVNGLISTFPALLERTPRPGGLGDANGDGVVTIADYYLMPSLYGIVLTEQQTRVDLNADSVVDERDSVLELEYLWMQRNTFPAEMVPVWNAATQGVVTIGLVGLLFSAGSKMLKGD